MKEEQTHTHSLDSTLQPRSLESERIKQLPKPERTIGASATTHYEIRSCLVSEQSDFSINKIGSKLYLLIHSHIKSSIYVSIQTLLALFYLLYTQTAQAVQSGSLHHDSAPMSEKCKSAILNYVGKKTPTTSSNEVLNQSTSDMTSFKESIYPGSISSLYPGILRDEYDYYKSKKDLKNYEMITLKKDEIKTRSLIQALDRDIQQIDKRGINRDKLAHLLVRKTELNQELSRIKDRLDLSSSQAQDLEEHINILNFENRFLIFASAISHRESKAFSNYVNWMKFIEPETARARACSEELLRKRIKDSKPFYTENRIPSEMHLADRILDDLTLRSFAEKSKDYNNYGQPTKQIQRSTASVKEKPIKND